MKSDVSDIEKKIEVKFRVHLTLSPVCLSSQQPKEEDKDTAKCSAGVLPVSLVNCGSRH